MKASLRWLVEHLLAPTVVGIVGVFVGIFISLQISHATNDWWGRPSCGDPRDLILIESDQVEVSSSETKGSGTDRDWSFRSLTDGDTATPWVPDQGAETPPWIQFEFDEEVDLALVCVVNGAPASEVGYQNAGKARSLKVTTGAAEDTPRTSPLSVLPTDVMQQRQPLNFDEGATTFLHLELLSSYGGIGAFDEKESVWREANGNVAIAEIEFYRRD